jgi:hypothetical protein
MKALTNRILLFLFILSYSQAAKGQLSEEYVNFKWLADSLYDKADYNGSAFYYRKICVLNEFRPRFDYYYTARCYIKLDKIDSAYMYLMQGAKKGERFYKKSDVDSDKVLAPLRKLKEWDKLRNILLKNFEEFENNPNRNDSIRMVLVNLSKKDQGIRMQFASDSVLRSMSKKIRDSLMDEWTRIDKEDEIELKKIIEKYGWPGLNMVGDDGEQAAWLIAQHSDRDTAFQVLCFGKIMTAILKYDATLSNVAYLQDRVLVNRKKEQIYGTQYRVIDEKYTPLPIGDEKNVNKRRHAMTLSTLEAYLKMSGEYYPIEHKK